MKMIAGALLVVAGAILFAAAIIGDRSDGEAAGYLGGLAVGVIGAIVMVRGWLADRPKGTPRSRNEDA